MTLNDPRVTDVLTITDQDNIEDISQSDYDKVEDHYIAIASELVLENKDLSELRDAGFSELANKLLMLNSASRAYDWTRENL